MATGAGLLLRAKQHIGEEYRNERIPKDDPNWRGPWDCAEFASWLVYQEAGILYGCTNNNVAPRVAEAYTGAWRNDSLSRGIRISVEQAAATEGAFLLRYPPGAGEMGHIAVSDGRGGTVEAMGRQYGVRAGKVQGRRWDTGVLIPGITYGTAAAPVPVQGPIIIYAQGLPNMQAEVVRTIKAALRERGYDPGPDDGTFGQALTEAVARFQDAKGLLVDGEVGPQTAGALGISLDGSAVVTDGPDLETGDRGDTSTMPPLVLFAASLLPDLLRLFVGDREGRIAAQVADVAKQVFGTDNKDVVEQQVNADPQKKAELQIRLAEIAAAAAREQREAADRQRRLELEFYQDQLAEAERVRQAELERYQLDLADRNAARDRQTVLETSESIFAWVAPILAFVVTIGLMILMYNLATMRSDLQNKDVFNALLGAITTAFITIVNFYFGSSVGSKEKDNMIAKGQLVTTEPGSPPTPTRSGGPPSVLSPAPTVSPPPVRPASGGGGAPPPLSFPPPTGPLALFRQKAPVVMRQLMSDFDLTATQAAGVLGNIGHECNGFRTLQEVAPRGGRGGWGWLQWTGPRRRNFEEWCRQSGLSDGTADAANYGFLAHELRGAEGRNVLPALRRTTSIDAATQVFMAKFERPGVPHLDGRIRFANIALAEYGRTTA